MEVGRTNLYEINAKLFKVLSDPNRLKIIEILSCGERCACDIQAYFEFTQPTLSHHMKSLMESGLVNCRKEGQWSYYGLNTEKAEALMSYFSHLTADTEVCLCKEVAKQNLCNEKSCHKNKE